MASRFQHLECTADWRTSFNLMRVLRPHRTDEAAYLAQLERQTAQGYRLLAAFEGEAVVGLAGYRTMENLLYGRFIYVDDLVVHPDVQSRGLGAGLLDAVRQQASEQGHDHLVLDTGLHMPLAQRFYFRQGLLARGMHFTQSLRADHLASTGSLS